MNTPIDALYRLKSSEGYLSWNTCNKINSQLIDMIPENVPQGQIQNVCEYLIGVLLYESAILEHRIPLARFLYELWGRHAK